MKLTLVSIVFHGEVFFRFVMLPYIDGKAVVSPNVLRDLKGEAGVRRGDTYSIA